MESCGIAIVVNVFMTMLWSAKLGSEVSSLSAQLSAIKCSTIVVLCAKKCNFVNKTPARKCSNTYGKNCISETCRMER